MKEDCFCQENHEREKHIFFRFEKPRYGSGWVSRRHAAFAPASQKRLDSRLRSPFPSVEEPCPLSLPYGLLDTQPDPLRTMDLRMLA